MTFLTLQRDDTEQGSVLSHMESIQFKRDEGVDEPEDSSYGGSDDEDDELNGQQQRKGAWTTEEDQVLRTMILDENITSWPKIAARIPGRTSKQCRERWKCNLDPSINKEPWTAEEDEILLSLQKKLGNRWAVISKSLKGRTENSIKTRYRSIQRRQRREWSKDEDRNILTMRLKQRCRWETIAEALPKRTKNGVKNRFKALMESNSMFEKLSDSVGLEDSSADEDDSSEPCIATQQHQNYHSQAHSQQQTPLNLASLMASYTGTLSTSSLSSATVPGANTNLMSMESLLLSVLAQANNSSELAGHVNTQLLSLVLLSKFKESQALSQLNVLQSNEALLATMLQQLSASDLLKLLLPAKSQPTQPSLKRSASAMWGNVMTAGTISADVYPSMNPSSRASVPDIFSSLKRQKVQPESLFSQLMKRPDSDAVSTLMEFAVSPKQSAL